MALFVLSYPEFSQADIDWIQSVREKHDELYYNVVGPHMTFVYPVYGLSGEQFIEHIQTQASSTQEIEFELRSALVVKDPGTQYKHVFLVPDKGYGRMVRLHDKLYSGVLERELSLEMTFIPHMGIGNSPDASKCRHLAASLNEKDFSIAGRIKFLDVVLYENDRVETVERVKLR